MKQAPQALITRYARSLFHVAVERNVAESVRADLTALRIALDEHKEFAAMLLNPSVHAAKVKALAESLATKIGSQDLTRQFITLLVDKDRLEILYGMAPAFDKLYREHIGQIDVTVTTAVTATEQVQQHITAHLAQRSGKKPVVRWAVDPSILGGVIIHWPDRVFDGSLARKIESLKTQMAGTV